MPKVAILDSELLDHDILNVLLEPLQKSLALVNTSFKSRLEPELILLIQATLYKLSVWDSSASYGAKLQDLRYIFTCSSPHANTIPARILLIHGSLTILLPYFHARIRAYALSHSWADAPSRDHRRRGWEVLTFLESVSSSLALLNFAAFLWTGKYRTIMDRATGMALVPVSRVAHRDVSYEFMNRQMVWHAFTEFLLFALPLINARNVRQRISRATSQLSPASLLPSPIQKRLGINQTSTTFTKPTKGPYWSLPCDQCAICAEEKASTGVSIASATNALTPSPYSSNSTNTHDSPPETTEMNTAEDEPPNAIHTPYMASCGDVYCYHCLAERMLNTAEDDERANWTCLRCGMPVTSAERQTAAIETYSDSEFDSFTSNGSELDDMETSVSMGSISEEE